VPVIIYALLQSLYAFGAAKYTWAQDGPPVCVPRLGPTQESLACGPSSFMGWSGPWGPKPFGSMS
jgi:hypothetical protein